MSKNTVSKTSFRALQADTTRQRLFDVGREMFGQNRYSAVSAQDIADRANVTRGALYHHFKTGKLGLFEAVAEAVLKDLVMSLTSSAAHARPGWSGIRDMLEAYFKAALTNEHRHVALQEAPSVLGSEKWRQLEYTYSVRFLHVSLEQLIMEGTIRQVPVKPLATLMFGALCEATLAISDATNTTQAINETLDTFELMLEGIRI